MAILVPNPERVQVAVLDVAAPRYDRHVGGTVATIGSSIDEVAAATLDSARSGDARRGAVN